MDTVLKAQGLSYGPNSGAPLQSHLDFSLLAGHALWVEGKNGSGKSSLLQIILGHQKPMSGSLDVRPGPITHLPQLENIALHLPLTLGDVFWLYARKKSSAANHPLLKGLPDHWQELAWSTASGGERKRCLLAALLENPEPLVLLDEPFNHLDARSQTDLAQLLQGLLDRGHALVLVSHRAQRESLSPVTLLTLGATDA